MRRAFQFILRVVPRRELKRYADFRVKAETVAVFVGDFHIAHIGAVAVFLRAHVVVLKVCYGRFVNADCRAGLAVAIGFLGTAAIPLDIFKLARKRHLRAEARQRVSGRAFCENAKRAVGVNGDFRKRIAHAADVPLRGHANAAVRFAFHRLNVAARAVGGSLPRVIRVERN